MAPIYGTIKKKFWETYGGTCVNKRGNSFLKFVFDCICKFFDCVVGNPGPIFSDNYKIIGASFIGFALFSISVFAVLFLIDRKFDLNNKLSWIISIAIEVG